MNIPSALLKVGGILILVASTHSPVAVIEEVSGGVKNIEFMDYVETGKVIRLGSEGSIVLGYLTSCLRETITGGTVIVGMEQSNVEGGMVERSTVPCHGGKMLLTSELANKSAAMVFRDMSHGGARELPQPQLVLYGRSPLIEVKPTGVLVIERIDVPGEQHEIVLSGVRLVHGAFFDLAMAGVVLAAGGVYRAKAGEQEMVFKIDQDARSGQTPVIGRLLRLQTAH